MISESLFIVDFANHQYDLVNKHLAGITSQLNESFDIVLRYGGNLSGYTINVVAYG